MERIKDEPEPEQEYEPPKRSHKRIEYYDQYEDDDDSERASQFNYLDLILYIISGVDSKE